MSKEKANPLPDWAVLFIRLLLQLLSRYGCPIADALLEINGKSEDDDSK